MGMRIVLLTIFSFGILYAAGASRVYVNFVNDARTFVCHGKNVRWVLPIGAQVPENSTKYRVVAYGGQEGSQLTIKNINPVDIGEYRCVAEDKTEKFELKVYYPLTVEPYPSTVVARKNQDLSLKCRTNGVPQAQIEWYHEEDKLTQSSAVRINANELTLKQIQPEQAGTYTCLAIQNLDSLKNVQEIEIKVVVEYGPTRERNIPSISYHGIGSTATIQCHAKSVPNSQFKWVRNGYEIFEGVTNFNDDSRLTILIDSVKSLGNYSCEASNKHGELHQTFSLKDKADEPNQANQENGSNIDKISVSLVFFTVTSILAKLAV